MKHIHRVLAILLVAASLLSLAACGKGEDEPAAAKVDPQAAFMALVTQVTYDTEIKDVGDSGAMYFPGLPAGSKVQMYAGSGYFADMVALITGIEDQDAVLKSVKDYLSAQRVQFQSYIPEEVPKIDKAIIWQQNDALILCVTADYKKAQSVLDNAASLEPVPSKSEPTESQTPSTEAPSQETSEATTAPSEPQGYPVLQSTSGTYSFHDQIFEVDHTAFEGYAYSEQAGRDYANVVNKVAANLKGVTKVYALPICTSIGIVFPDDTQKLVKKFESQGDGIASLGSMLSEDVILVDSYDNLMKHRDEYLYFKTDHHWTARGAYYAYETFCKVKGVAPYTLEQRDSIEFPGFKGSLYAKMTDPADTVDTVIAYYPHFKESTMSFTDNKGNTMKWDIIKDVSDWGASSKYNTFAAGDNPYSEFHNPGVTDGSVCIVVKESFGCALMPFIVDHYSTVYEIDYRYWSGSLTEFAKKVGADDLIFANNLMRLYSGFIAGDLNKIV